MPDRKPLWLIAIVALAAILVWLAFFWDPEVAPTPTAASGHSRSLADTAPAGGDFTLRGSNGAVALADFRGKVVLVYFGYTFCPDVCPTSLVAIGEAIAALSPTDQEKVAALFVSVNPERDTPEVLSIYAPFFHPRILGISGTPSEVARVAQQYGVRYSRQNVGNDRPYAVDHSTFVYLVGRDGKLIASLPHGMPSGEMAARIRDQLSR